MLVAVAPLVLVRALGELGRECGSLGSEWEEDVRGKHGLGGLSLRLKQAMSHILDHMSGGGGRGQR